MCVCVRARFYLVRSYYNSASRSIYSDGFGIDWSARGKQAFCRNFVSLPAMAASAAVYFRFFIILMNKFMVDCASNHKPITKKKIIKKHPKPMCVHSVSI